MKRRWHAAFVLVIALLLTGSTFEALAQGSEPIPVPSYQEGKKGLIEIYHGELVWVNKGESLGFPSAADEGIHLQVLNQQSQPAAQARVEAYELGQERRRWSGQTDDAGRAEVAVPDGTWILVISSERDHFVIVREGVTAPGSLTLDTTGTVPVEVAARRLNGEPLPGAEISFERFAEGMNFVGQTDSAGHLHVDLTPATYCGLAASWNERIYLNRRGVTVTGSGSVAFDASQMEIGQVIIQLSNLAQIGFSMDPEPSCRSWSPIFDVANGQIVWLSADRYALGLHRDLRDEGDIRWIYYYDVKDTPHNITAGSTATVQGGEGTYVASVNPRQTVYQPGAIVYLDQQVLDHYGNRLRQISRGPEQTVVSAHILIRGLQGEIVYEGDCRSTRSSCPIALRSDAPHGRYEVEWSLDTGPLQGVLQATTTFSVEGTPVPSTNTPTPTRSMTPTPTCTPTLPPMPWKLHLPLLLKNR